MATDTDTWDVSFPIVSHDDLVLWDSDLYSNYAKEKMLESQFFADIRSGRFIPAGDYDLSIKEEKEEVKKKCFNAWQALWFSSTHRWQVMEKDLRFIEDILYDSNEVLPSSLVLCFLRGWSNEGIGHTYGLISAASSSSLIELIRSKFIPEELDDGECYSILVPKDSTLTLEFLGDPYYDDDGKIVTDPDGVELYESGSVLEFYHVKPTVADMFLRLKKQGLIRRKGSANNTGVALNKFCEAQITKHGKAAFINSYLDKIDNPIKHAWLGDELDPYWDITKQK